MKNANRMQNVSYLNNTEIKSGATWNLLKTITDQGAINTSTLYNFSQHFDTPEKISNNLNNCIRHANSRVRSAEMYNFAQNRT